MTRRTHSTQSSPVQRSSSSHCYSGAVQLHVCVVVRRLTGPGWRISEWRHTNQQTPLCSFCSVLHLNENISADLSASFQFLTQEYIVMVIHTHWNVMTINSVVFYLGIPYFLGLFKIWRNQHLHTIHLVIQYVPKFIFCIHNWRKTIKSNKDTWPLYVL